MVKVEDKNILDQMRRNLDETNKLYHTLSEETKQYLIDNCTNNSIESLGMLKRDMEDMAWEGKIVK